LNAIRGIFCRAAKFIALEVPNCACVMLSTNISINGLKLVRLVQIKILRERKEI
jgi:hypothetical protein